MRGRFLAGVWGLALLLGGCPAGGGESDGGSDGGAADGGGDAGIVDVAFGVEVRPANPTCVAPDRPASGATVELVEAFPDLPSFSAPIFATPAPGSPDRFFVVEKGGVVRAFASDAAVSSTEVFVDISGRVDDGPNEAGLLGLAFHPDFASNGEVFLSYTATGLVSRLSRFVSRDGGQTLDPGSEEILLQVDQPYGNHNGGMIAFGPDGFLYFGLGDGGSGGDPLGHGQDTSTLLGAILRIDVDGGSPYAIPADNPFASGVGGAPEIHSWGLRNPWRFSFDRSSGELWVGDVGQGTLEEVDRIVRPGGNYGWNTMEGDDCYGGGGCDPTGLELPVAVYGRSEGQSITGGYVYRGAALPELEGVYLYADFASGVLWGLFTDESTGAYTSRRLLETGMRISSFAEDAAGELYLVQYGPGRLHRIVRSGAPPADTFPRLLSATGCTDPLDATVMAEGVLPFGVEAPLWSDDAEKKRWLAIPDGETITVEADGDWSFPVGSVLFKEFARGGRRLETRMLVRHLDGQWAGYAYEWNAGGTEAVLLAAGKRLQTADGGWSIPSRGECLQCHTVGAGWTLGPETASLNGDLVYPGGRRANQVATLDHIGLIDLPADPATLPALPRYDSAAPIAERARAYLHTNCAFCHRPGSSGLGDIDLRFATSLAEMNACGRRPQRGYLGLADGHVITPGDPATSILSLRMHATDVGRMPPLGTERVDAEGTALVDGWISGMTDCN